MSIAALLIPAVLPNVRTPLCQSCSRCVGCVQVDVCKLLAKFPRPMSACVRECFLRMGELAPELRERLAAWLALHLSNFDFMWPWERWRHVLDAPSHDSQR